MLQTKFVEKIITHFTFNNFFSEKRAVYGMMWEKSGRFRQAADNIIKRLECNCMLGNQGYGHTLRICIASCFSDDNGYANAPQCYLNTFTASPV